MESLQNKCAIITGAATGIGRATAILLASYGANVFASDINDEKGQETVSQITEAGGTASYLHCDVSDQDQVKEMTRQAEETYGHVSLAVNNAGIGSTPTLLHEMPLSDWRKILSVNLDGVFFCMQEQLTYMLEHGGGSIVNVASLAGIGGTPMASPYGVSKHGVVNLTKSAALEYANSRIRVNAVCPGWTETPILDHLGVRYIEAQINQVIPMKRLGQPEEIAEAIVWLLSDNASYISGHCLNIDGGIKAL